MVSGRIGPIVGGMFLSTTKTADALDAYLAENGFSKDEYIADSALVHLGPIPFRIPNPASRKKAIPLHDLHHVATGFGTDMIGEGEIGAWELGAGCTTLYVYFLNFSVSVVGFFLAPRRILDAFASGRRATSLYRLGVGPDAVTGIDVGALRRMLGLPEEGIAEEGTRGLHPKAPRPVPHARESRA